MSTEAATSTVRYLSGRPRETRIELDEPVELDGVTYTGFAVRRLTARDLEDHARRTLKERERRPLANVDIAPEVLAVLDADDATRLQEAAFDFLPLSWKAVIEPTPPQPGPTPSNSADGPVTDSNEASTATGSTS